MAVPGRQATSVSRSPVGACRPPFSPSTRRRANGRFQGQRPSLPMARRQVVQHRRMGGRAGEHGVGSRLQQLLIDPYRDISSGNQPYVVSRPVLDAVDRFGPASLPLILAHRPGKSPRHYAASPKVNRATAPAVARERQPPRTRDSCNNAVSQHYRTGKQQPPMPADQGRLTRLLTLADFAKLNHQIC